LLNILAAATLNFALNGVTGHGISLKIKKGRRQVHDFKLITASYFNLYFGVLVLIFLLYKTFLDCGDRLHGSAGVQSP